MSDDARLTELQEKIAGLLDEYIDVLGKTFDADGDVVPMQQPVVQEWLLIRNCVDLVDGDSRTGHVTAPSMLRSHAIGLVTIALDNLRS